MEQNLLLKFFPVPKYLTPLAFGLDISDRSIKFMELLNRQQKLLLGRFGEKDIPLGVIEGGELKDPEQFKNILQELKNELNLENVFISLPDDKAFTFNLILPPMSLTEVRGSIELQLEEYVPLPANEIVFDYELVKPIIAGANLEVGVFALPRSIVMPYVKVFEEVGIKLLAIETQSEALARALVYSEDVSTVVIVDIGRNHTASFLLKNGTVIAASAIPVGGEAITASLEKNLKLDFSQAEKLKMEKGLSRAENNREAFYSIIPVVSAIKDEIGRRINFWIDYQESNTTLSLPIKNFDRIILCGGQSTLPGLAEYLEINLQHPVSLGNPWLKIFPHGTVVSGINFNEALRYSTAIGLALRNFNE